MPGLRIEETRGTPSAQPDQQITPIARVVHLTWPGGRFDWYRPVAVEVTHRDRTRRIPIRNVTRQIMAGIILAELVLGALAWWAEQTYLRRRTAR
jgi:hypothetical protein